MLIPDMSDLTTQEAILVIGSAFLIADLLSLLA